MFDERESMPRTAVKRLLASLSPPTHSVVYHVSPRSLPGFLLALVLRPRSATNNISFFGKRIYGALLQLVDVVCVLPTTVRSFSPRHSPASTRGSTTRRVAIRAAEDTRLVVLAVCFNVTHRESVSTLSVPFFIQFIRRGAGRTSDLLVYAAA
ncbi:hypothetical protein MVEN_00442600 [Mycena venus]|uniref:Uncharacterized protein n=1 Tax=Mycena venus TaxID=2733690 RepID=A0A8H6YVY6_9AGAR|nr:hypothetical protein MVEN_00442600 [Mycena venus]